MEKESKSYLPASYSRYLDNPGMSRPPLGISKCPQVMIIASH